MLTTGILSLNIHDSLTFEGTELCLNPDLFSVQHGVPKRGGADDHTQQQRSGGIGSSSIHSGNSGTTSQTSMNTPLAVGDIIEIRVWDPLPKEAAAAASSSSNVLRKAVLSRHSSQPNPLVAAAAAAAAPPTIPVASTTTPFSGSGFHGSSEVSAAAATAALKVPSLLPRAEAFGEAKDATAGGHSPDTSSKGISQQPLETATSSANRDELTILPSISDDDPPPPSLATNDAASIPNVAASTTTATNSLTASMTPPPNSQQSLPPVFPRGRPPTSTDHPSLPTTPISKRPKPIAMHRRVVSSAGAIPIRSPKQQQHYPYHNQQQQPSRHVRDISDMTVDTHQLDLSGVAVTHSMDSHDLFAAAAAQYDDFLEASAAANEASLYKIMSSHRLRLSFVLKATEKTFTSFKGNSRTQISMLRQVADLYNLSTYDLVTVHKIEAQDEEEVLKAVSADFVVVTIKDQFISRGDMLLFQTQLLGSWIYEGERLTENTRGIKAHAREIRHGNYSAKSGIVTDKTMITFRSRSARIVWLVQLSEEMWELSSPYEHQFEPESICEIYFDKWIRFLYKLFRKWKELEVTHSLTVIFFSRTFLSNGKKSSIECQDVYGREFEDHYKPVIENESCLEWESLVVKIKEEFIRYPLEVGWNLHDRRPSSASQGNILEAINVTLNLMQYHYLDRDLHRTGQSIVIVSPGSGVFEVDKGLSSITYQRMLDNGIGSDMLSLGLPPLHIAPFFLYNNDHRSYEGPGIDATGSEKYFEVPHYMHLSFVTYDRPEERRVYLSNLEDKRKPVQTHSWIEGFDVGPNGFLRPHLIQEIQPSNHEVTARSPRSSFSLVGNKAATPGKASVVQERGHSRQLISGRNFRDILEACRPRQLGASLPLPLKSILSLKEIAIIKKIAKMTGAALPVKEIAPKDVPLREWGTVDFGDHIQLQGYSRSRLSPSPSTSMFKVAEVSPATMKAENAHNSDVASPGSSFASSPLSSTYGTSYDRVFWDYYDSPKTPMRAFQIQRSPSFEFEKASIEGEREMNDESLAASDAASKNSIGGESDTNHSQTSKPDKHLKLLREFMDGYDASICKQYVADVPNEPGDKVLASDNHSLAGNDNAVQAPLARFQRRAGGNEGRAAVGGLGAALSQYSTSTNEPSSLFADSSTNLMKHRTSGGNLLLSSQSRTASFQSERKRAASPMLNSMFQFQERQFGSPKLFSSVLVSSSTLLEPPDLYRSDRQNSAAILRPNPNRLSAVRDQHWSTSTSSVLRQGNTIGRGMPSSSVPHFDLNRQKLQSIAHSPPSNMSLYDSSFSPGEKDSSVVPKKGVSRSPPKSGMSRERSLPVKSSTLSPPKGGILMRERSGPPRTGSRGSPHSSVRGMDATRRQKAFNPFRQSDEDEVLAKRSHNRRRWSHVFPAGEVEFKRHAGPIWNSLTSPAILPLSVDYFPSPQELRDETRFQFNFYQVTLGGIENKHYATHSDLLMEMVRQRVTQDFQVVTSSAVEESERRAFEARKGTRTPRRPDPFPRPLSSIPHETPGTMKHYLSMGHRIQVLNYNPTSDAIEIIGYNRKSAQNDRENVYNYRFLLYSKVTEQYTQSVQTFKKYSEPYKWNRVDNLICGEEDRTMDVGMRFRRLMFGLIPEVFQTIEAEEEYISKFQKLLSYLEKLREKHESDTKLHVPIISSKNRDDHNNEEVLGAKTRHDMTESMIKFSVQLLRGKKDPFEWIEIAIDPTFDTMNSYRIMFNWLVASSSKVETQLQLLQRRCTQFGLKLISFPQTAVSWHLFLHALAVPTFLTIRDTIKAKKARDILKELDFLYDGMAVTSSQFLECIDNAKEFSFPRYRSGKIKSIPSTQYVHRSGALFVRKMADRSGKVILVGIENYRHASNENMFREITRKVVHELTEKICKLEMQDEEEEGILSEDTPLEERSSER